MKRFFLFLSVTSLMCILQSHELWLEPVKFKIKPGEELILNFLAGENFMGQPFDLNTNAIERILILEKGPSQDITSKMPKAKDGKLKTVLTNTGTKIVAIKSNNSPIEVTGEKFNDYLTSYGLEDVYDWRINNGQENSAVRESYTQYSKLIVQVGETLDDNWKRQVGHSLEIIPDQNPGSLKSGDYMGCQILYERRPLPHAQVKVWGHVGNKIFLQNIYSEDDGTIRFPISARGPWLVSAVKMEGSKKSEVNWESSRAILVFNIE